jgi:L-iditol 2-dehydrogenase
MSGVLAAVMPGPNEPVEVRELDEPELEQDSALLAVELSEVCGTDVHLQRGRLAGVPYPLIPGHVSVGRLEKIRGRMLDVDGRAFREGDRVTFLDVHRTCHACWHCLVAKTTTRCPSRKVYGITYGLRDTLAGGWAEKIYLKPGTRPVALGGVDAARFMAGGCALPTALHAVERADIPLGSTVLVLGSGPVGLSAIALSLMRGALRVICTGAPAPRLAAARSVGASAVLDVEGHAPEGRAAWVMSETEGRGADVCIEATGAPGAVVEAMRYARDAGTVVVVGQYTDHGEVAFNPHLDLNRKHLDVRGCWGSDFSHFYRGARLMGDAERSAPWSRLALETYGLARAGEALEAVASGRVVKALIDPRA